jgi:hypothetical protein
MKACLRQAFLFIYGILDGRVIVFSVCRIFQYTLYDVLFALAFDFQSR